MILKCEKIKNQNCVGCYCTLLTEKHMGFFLGTGEVLSTISELIMVLETSIT